MVRLAKVGVPGVSHRVTQRENRRQGTFFRDDDSAYLELMAQWSTERRARAWCYGVMPNHVDLIVVHASHPRRSGGRPNRLSLQQLPGS